MLPIQFYRIVVKMRKYQKLYDRGHAPGVLRQAREYERVVDAELERMEIVIQETDKQTKLFEQNEQM